MWFLNKNSPQNNHIGNAKELVNTVVFTGNQLVKYSMYASCLGIEGTSLVKSVCDSMQ